MSDKARRALEFPLLLMVTVNLLPALYLKPAWTVAFCGVMMAYRFWINITDSGKPPRWLMLIVQLSAGGAIWMSYKTYFGEEPAGTFLMLLSCLKTYELNKKRDFFVGVVLCFFVLMSFLLLDQYLVLTLFLLADVLLLLGYLYALEEEKFEWSRFRRYTLPGVWLTFKAVPLMIALFVLFPRFTTGFGQGGESVAHVGMADSLRPGSVSKLIQSDELMFRAAFLDGLVPSPQSLYWRGAILDHAQGLNWDRGATRLKLRAPQVSGAPQVEVYLEAANERTLFTLDTTLTVEFPNDPAQTRMNLVEGHTFELERPLANRERYVLHNGDVPFAGEDAAVDPDLGVGEILPSELKLKIESFRRADDPGTVKAVLDYFKRGGFTYTLEPRPVGTLADFLLRTKSGFCEHYAAATAAILRTLKVPARVVVGFQGGTPSLLDNFISVRARDAHAWVEFYDATVRRWRRVDPTAEVEPQRIALGSVSYNGGDTGFAAYLERTRALFDEIDARWSSFLLRFDLSQQQQLLAHFGMEGVLFRALPVFMILALILMLAVLYFFEAHKREKVSEVEALNRRLLRRLKRLGADKLATEGPQGFLERLFVEQPQLAGHVDPILAELTKLKFGLDTLTRGRAADLRRRIARLRRNRAK